MALIDTDHNAIFIHIYKTGGTSIRNLMTGTECCDIHSPAFQIRQHLQMTNQLNVWNDAFKFCVVRNPYDFAISLFHHLHDHRKHFCHKYATGTIDEFYQTLIDGVFDNVPLNDYSFIQSQSYFVTLNKTVLVDRVFRFENIDTIPIELNKIINTESRQVKMNVSKTRNRDIRFDQLLKPKTIEIINKLYNDDFINFDYQKIQ